MMQNSIMRPYRSCASKICLFVLACLLVGCSAIRLGYSNGESVVYWWMDSYVNFQAEQQPVIRKNIKNFFVWHRKTQLPEYAQLLSQWQQKLHHNVTPAEVAGQYDDVRKRMLLVVDKALPELTDLALAMDADQIAHLEKKFASNNEKYRKEYLRGDLEERQLHRYKKIMKQAEYWFGDFSREQEARIRALSDSRPLDNEQWLEERMRRQNEMIATLKRIHTEKPGRDAALRTLKNFVAASTEHFGDARRKAFFDESEEGTVQLVTGIINLTTPEQKAFAQKRVQQWIEDCHSMAAK